MRNVTTDSDGDWSGSVTLSGDTDVDEVMTATATRFVEPGESLAGSTSEFSECLADLSITKTDEPDPVAVGGTLTYTLDVVNAGPAPATAVRVVDTLPLGVTVGSITASQGTCSRVGSTVTCLLGQIDRDGPPASRSSSTPGRASARSRTPLACRASSAISTSPTTTPPRRRRS